MLVTATTYTDVRAAARTGSASGEKPARTSAFPHVRVAKSKRMDPRQFIERELRTGGYFHRYVAKEKSLLPAQIRQVARGFHAAKPKYSDLPKAAKEGEWELQYALPARLYWRFKAMDPHFFDDPANLRALRRDNPELCIYR